MKRNNLTGTKSNEQYHDLRNNFIGIALSDADHSSMPLVSVAIYCCVARRLNMNASPCSLPFHSLAIVKPEKDKDLNGRYVDFPSGAELLYMDPFRSDQEISIADLQAQLSAMGVTASDYPALLGPSTTADIIRRTARSIIASVKIMPRSRGHNRKMTSLYPDADRAFYGALWALLLLPDGNPMAASMQRTRYLPYLVEHIENSCLMDVRLIQDHILPLFQNLEQCDKLTDSIRAIRAVDSVLKDVKKRTTNPAHNVKYYVGQVFKHRRYNYEAIITGWDAQCEASDEWMTQMGVADLPQGKHQSFYRVL